MRKSFSGGRNGRRPLLIKRTESMSVTAVDEDWEESFPVSDAPTY